MKQWYALYVSLYSYSYDFKHGFEQPCPWLPLFAQGECIKEGYIMRCVRAYAPTIYCDMHHNISDAIGKLYRRDTRMNDPKLHV